MEIKDIKLDDKLEYADFFWKDIEGNASDDGRMYCCISYDRKYCATGIIIDHKKNIKNKNPPVRITNIFKTIIKNL